MKHAAENHLSYRDALIQIRKRERKPATYHGSAAACLSQSHEIETSKQSTMSTELRSTANKECSNLDVDSPDAGVDNASGGVPRLVIRSHRRRSMWLPA